ncbi:hypothetical protein SCP_1403070 [Sparassis crispa]|uniref:C2H2-type domain-containing protein n=1 Tax=Sparassis crispa TaxID=139825 RepID=A0A401H3D4_9APHY|nr:hypothetical protein SCP_1403070 [Sparassis crispa]GBE88899.1 hypothetical protein SCP_1403070 [Sparassis crispa]
MPNYVCSFCHHHKKSTKSLHSHISQKRPCRLAFYRKLQKGRVPVIVNTRVPEGELEVSGDAENGHGSEESMEVDELPFDAEDLPVDPPLQTRTSMEIEELVQLEHPAQPHSRCVTVEEVEDEEYRGLLKCPWIQDFPPEFDVAAVLCEAKTEFETLRDEKAAAGEESWHPFASRDEWELAHWLMTAGLSQTATDNYLNLPITRERTNLSFHNKRAFYQKIDALPQGPSWSCEPWEVTGDLLDEKGQPRKKTLELWKRDPVECIKELIGNPAFKDAIRYAPEKVFADCNGDTRIYDETWTGQWWWDLQEIMPDGATIAPVILSSNKTQLSNFSGDKSAWPVYLSIGNIRKSTRRQPSAHATILIGYLSVTKLECFSEGQRSIEGVRLFHSCMRSLLDPLIKAGKDGIEMVCANGCVRRVYPILAAYIADHPEQCLVSGCRESHCPKCTVSPNQRGEPLHSLMRDPDVIETVLSEASQGLKPDDFKDLGLKLIDPFWRELPHCNIFACITPDILHQLHKGVFKDHLVNWVTQCMNGNAAEIDQRFKAMTTHPDLRHFNKGISLISQWMGAEYKNMEKVFLGVIIGASDPAVLCAVRSVLDFIYYAHFEAHTDDSIAKLEAAWKGFHANKHVFVEKSIRKDFNIPKAHSAKHYGGSIRSLGTVDGFNTENSERLHIDFAKRAYSATNKKAYLKQMTAWLT